MPQIINLSPIGDVQPGDAIPVFDESNGDARRMSVGQLSTYMEATLSLPDNAADIDYDPAGTGAVQRTVQSKLRETVSVKDFGAVGDGSTDDILAIEAALAASSSVYFPTGVYGISRPIVIQKEKVRLFGPGGYGPYGSNTVIGGSGLATISVLAGFTGTTVGGSTGSAAIWYQAPGTWTDNDWIEGGCFENLTIACNNRGVEGVRINRVTLGQVFRNLRIVQPTIGIYGTKWGWLTEFDNVYVNEPSVTGIRLTNGYNGCTFTNCSLYGGNITSQVLLDMALDCYGNSWTGGFIEGAQVGVRLTNAQIAFHGTDFEVITEKFFEIRGQYTGPTLDFANPVVAITGCTFVGVPSAAGIEVQGGVAEVHGNFFINTGAAPGGTVYCLKGIAGGDQTVSGFEQPCISESDNVLRGWNGQLATGIVFSRIKRVATEGVTFPTTAVASANANTLDDYTEGTFTPTMAGTGWGAGMTASGKYTKIGNRVDFTVVIIGSTNSSVRTSSYLTGFPASIVSSSVASISDSYNADHGCTAIVSGFGNIVVYMPSISSTAANIIVFGTYFTA